MKKLELVNKLAHEVANNNLSGCELEKAYAELYKLCEKELQILARSSYLHYGDIIKLDLSNFYSIADASFITAVRGVSESSHLKGKQGVVYNMEKGSFIQRVKYFYNLYIKMTIRLYNANSKKVAMFSDSGDIPKRDKNADNTGTTVLDVVEDSNVDIEREVMGRETAKTIVKILSDFRANSKTERYAKIIQTLIENPNQEQEILRHIYNSNYGESITKDTFRQMIRRARLSFKKELEKNFIYV